MAGTAETSGRSSTVATVAILATAGAARMAGQGSSAGNLKAAGRSVVVLRTNITLVWLYCEPRDDSKRLSEGPKAQRATNGSARDRVVVA